MGFLPFLRVICSTSSISAQFSASVNLQHTLPIPLLPKVADVLVLSELLDDDPAGEP